DGQYSEYELRMTAYNNNKAVMTDYDYASEQAQTGQDFEDDIIDLLNRALNPMFFRPGGSSSQVGQ
ncbi:hypothetical protein A2U01_0056731, partial [Trifolium medium]|nr:hypothetical protein [Trifolium medium]